MKILGPTRYSRLNEAMAFVWLALAIGVTLSLGSYHPTDPSLNLACGDVRPRNLVGYPGAYLADWLYQVFGITAFLLPVLLLLMAWKWVRSQPIEAPAIKLLGIAALVSGLSAAVSLGPEWKLFGGVISPGGLVGTLLATYLLETLNPAGAWLATALGLVISVYLVSAFEMAKIAAWFHGPAQWLERVSRLWSAWRIARRRRKEERARKKAEAKAAKLEQKRRKGSQAETRVQTPPGDSMPAPLPSTGIPYEEDAAPWEEAPPEEIPIRTLEDLEAPSSTPPPAPTEAEPEPEPAAEEPAPPRKPETDTPHKPIYKLPGTDLLNEPTGRPPYDSQELKDIAAKIKSKFEEFHVLGSVVQINPGPVVTTFEFKPDAGIRYSKIVTLNEDLCLGLQSESILIERIPGKPTVGIEVPNTKRELISLRQILESDEFRDSQAHLTLALGKDINGRIKVAALESMPHLLIAGSTGSGKSVMMNSMIMSILYRMTPEQVRMIMVDPKRVELGIYEGVPHLLTPVITDPRKANNALRNAVLEMERRLKLLASAGVRNIEQYNRKARQFGALPLSLFGDSDEEEMERLEPLPYIVIFIDELADLMMVERGTVEESICRLAQMARAVGMHLIVATQRPSVDVITGLIKANFPARISFRVASRVDSRTILDGMGAEHLLGKGDMLFMPPGSSRLIRLHGAFVTENEINRVVEFWRRQAQPEYDQSYLSSPPSDEDAEEGEFDAEQDPMYADAVRVVVEMGKASTSTLQRRLRLGYGRAARILDQMQREGIIGPPDGSKPREVLRRPDWLDRVEEFR